MDNHHHHQTTTTKRKQEMRLDLKSPLRKRGKLGSVSNEILSTPDVMKLSLPTPDLEKFIISSNNETNSNSVVPLTTPSQVFFPKNVTQEQELYAKGFEEALAQLQAHQDNTNSSTFSDSTSNLSFDTTTGTNPGGHPIDMASQEKIKLERKRQRNRVAASKCRKRKLERIAKLEDKVKLLKDENSGLGEVLNRLKQRVNELKDNIKGHIQLGCNVQIKCEIND